jgi:hypothetical protein
VLNVLSQPAAVSSNKNPTVSAAVEAAVARNRDLQAKELESKARQDEREKQLGLYRYSCGALLEQLNPIVARFNGEFQHGKIARRRDAGATIFQVPQGQSIEVSFFEPKIRESRFGVGK